MFDGVREHNSALHTNAHNAHTHTRLMEVMTFRSEPALFPRAKDWVSREDESSLFNEPSRSTFQSSNPIGQYVIHNYMHICAIALTTP